MLKSISFQIKESIISVIDSGYNSNPWTNVYGLARTCLAAGLLLTLLFSGVDNLFPTVEGELLKQPNFFYDKISLFCILRDHLLVAWIISIIILFSVISGFLPQLTGILHWWITYSYLVSGIIIEGGDQISSIIALFLIPVTLTDNRLNHWSRPKENKRPKIRLFIWSIYVIIMLQVSVIYLHAGVAKLSVQEWLNGTAVYYWFTHSNFGVAESLKDSVSYFLSNSFICTSITWGTMIFEILLFGWLFMSRNKWNWKLIFISAVMFHFSIALVHGLVSFMFTMIGALVLYFFPKDLDIRFKNKTK